MFLPFFIILFTMITGLIIGLSKFNGVDKKFKTAARSLGLTFQKGTLFLPPVLTGKYAGFTVTVKHSYGSQHTPASHMCQIEFPSPRRFNFTIAPGRILDRLNRTFGIQDVDTGDRSFDELVHLEGSPEVLLGLLNATTRHRIIEAIESAFQKRFLITASRLETSFPTYEQLETRVETLIKLAQCIIRTGTTREQLRENFLAEEKSGVRLKLFQTLLELYPEERKEQTLINLAWKSPDPRLKIAAFSYAETFQTPAHLNLLWSACEPGFLKELLKALPRKENAHFLDILQDKYPGLQVEQKYQILGIFEKSASPQVSDFLVRQLEASTGKLQGTVIRALGSCGRADAVAPLMKVKSLFHGGAARKAVLEIQSRLKGGEHGWLSLTREMEGAGALAVTPGDEPEGRLSLQD